MPATGVEKPNAAFTATMKTKLLFGALWLLLACSSDDETISPIPVVPVYEEINLTNIQYQPLQNQGWIYLDGGYKGLLIIKDGNTYRVFDRACSYDFQEACGQADMDGSGFFIEDADCCESTFDLFGQPTGGPAQLPLQAYSAFVTGNQLIIQN